MNESYPAKYRDKYGEEITSIHNDGKQLTMIVHGIIFTGNNFDSLQTAMPLDDPQLKTFTLYKGNLADCEIECDMPITAVTSNQTTLCNLHIHLKLGKPLSNGAIDNEALQLSIDFDGKSFASCGQHGWFEDELVELHQRLPEFVYLKCCFNCAFSDYSPAGSGLFGGLACFRDNKEQYLKVENKRDLFQIWETMTDWVQETYLCAEFEKRVAGTGYRG